MKVSANPKSDGLIKTALIAAIYALLSFPFSPLSFGATQVRIAEALTILPALGPGMVGGLALGCVVTNLYGVMNGIDFAWDILIGSATTFVAGIFTYRCRNILFKGLPMIGCLPPILLNAVVIGAEITLKETGMNWVWPVLLKNILTVGTGQAVSCLVLGLPLFMLLKATIFRDDSGES
ncbi:transporter [Clostridia bacterium]|nr:transporter [Clostridia bacterium]